MRLVDLTGRRFGSWTVIARAARDDDTTAWLCECDCGTRRAVFAQNLTRGLSGSCGCRRNVTHGKSKDADSLYTTWEGIKQRTGNPRNPGYRNYGGRGIDFYPAWRDDYQAFERDILASLGARPLGMTLDRIDNDHGYHPGNLRWAERTQQQANRRNTRGLCSFPDCDRLTSARGLCQSHARQAAKGEELRPLRGRHKRP